MARMSMKEFGQLVRSVMKTLPPEFKPYLHNVVVDVAEEPDEEFLRRAGFTDEEIEEGDSLLGFFEPLELPTIFSGEAVHANEIEHRLWIFRNPHEEEFPDPKRLRTEIRKTVIHELAHHFGWSDRDLEKFDDDPDPFGDK
jgi:predicted Zn-dependent protease with MMP-like domain